MSYFKTAIMLLVAVPFFFWDYIKEQKSAAYMAYLGSFFIVLDHHRKARATALRKG